MKFKVNPFLIIYLFIIAMAILALSTGCSPVQRALGPKYYQEVKDSVIMRDGCKTDTIHLTDSTVTFDTIYVAADDGGLVFLPDKPEPIGTNDHIPYFADTCRPVVKIITKTVRTRDSVKYYDKEKERLLTDIVNKLNTKLIQTQQIHAEEVKGLKAQIKEESDAKKKWRRRFLFVVIALVIYLARKPLLQGGKKLLVLAARLVSPIKF